VHEFHLTRSVEESKAINNVKTPCIIISASGMVSGGRVLHHLVQRLPDARNAVILAGFQAEGTRGRALQEGAKSLKLYGQDVAGLRGDCGDGTVFPPTRERASVEMAGGAAIAPEANVFDPWRTGPQPKRYRQQSLKVSVEGSGSTVSGHRARG